MFLFLFSGALKIHVFFFFFFFLSELLKAYLKHTTGMARGQYSQVIHILLTFCMKQVSFVLYIVYLDIKY